MLLELGESLLIILAILLMLTVLVLSVVPFLPGPVLVWAVGLIFAVITQFQRVTPAAAGVMTVLMIGGSTSELWMPLFGLRASGLSCFSVIGSLIGSILGTFFIPIPLCGTLIGAIMGAMLAEIVRVGDWRRALTASKSTLELYLIGIVLEFLTSLAIFITFIVSLWSTS